MWWLDGFMARPAAKGLAALRVCSAAILFLLALSTDAAMRTTAVVRDSASGEPTVRKAAMVFERGALQIDTTSFTGGRARSDLIYRVSEKKLWQVDHADQSYVEVDERFAVAMADGVTRAVETVGGWLRGEAADGPALQHKGTGETKVIHGMTCERFEMLEGDVRVQDVWLAAWTEAGVGEDQMMAMRQLARASDSIVSTLTATGVLQGFPDLSLSGVAGLDGYPVTIRQYRGGRTVYEVILTKPHEVQPHPKRYKVDPGYKRRLL